MFKDPNTNTDVLLLVIPLMSGAKNVQFTVFDDGKHGKFSYEWPEIMYDIKKLFKTELHNGEILEYHPQCIAYNAELQAVRKTINESPRYTILIDFPIDVQKEEDTIKIKVGSDDSGHGKVVKIYLKGFSSSYLENPCKFIKID